MDYDFDSGVAGSNAAQRNWFAQNPVMPAYGNVQAGQAYQKPMSNAVPQVLGAPKPAQDPMLTANAALRARYAANQVTANATPQTSLLGSIGDALTKIFGSF